MSLLLLLLLLLSLLSLLLSALSEPLEATEVEAGFTAGPEGFAPGAQVADAGTSVTPTPPHSFLANWAETVSVSFARTHLGLQLGEGKGLTLDIFGFAFLGDTAGKVPQVVLVFTGAGDIEVAAFFSHGAQTTASLVMVSLFCIDQGT